MVNWYENLDGYNDGYSTDGDLYRQLSNLAYNVNLSASSKLSITLDGTAVFTVTNVIDVSGIVFISGVFTSGLSDLTPFTLTYDSVARTGVMFRLRAGTQTVYVDKIDTGQCNLTSVTATTSYPTLIILFA
jgi:hypothetical protein